MGIYIKNIEMPITCRDCTIGNPKLKTCYLLNEPKRNLERRSDCPLIAVQPHGDLVDRDVLMTEVMDSDLDHLQRDDWKEIIQIVEDAPAIIEGNL